MNQSGIKHLLRHNVQRQKEFFATREAGGLLAFVYTPSEVAADNVDLGEFTINQGLAGHIYRAVCAEDGSINPNEKRIRAAVETYVRGHRERAVATVWQRCSAGQNRGISLYPNLDLWGGSGEPGISAADRQ